MPRDILRLHAMTRSAARSMGLRTYYTGRLCPRGHDAPRYVSNGSCSACMNEDRPFWEDRTRDTRNARHNPKRETPKRRGGFGNPTKREG